MFLSEEKLNMLSVLYGKQCSNIGTISSDGEGDN